MFKQLFFENFCGVGNEALILWFVKCWTLWVT